MIPGAEGVLVRVDATWRLGRPDGQLRWEEPRCDGCAREEIRAFLADDIDKRLSLSTPESAADVLDPWLAGQDRERCVVALLDTKHRLLDVVVNSVGTVDHTFMNPREILRDALVGNAAAIVVAHNHPSGDPTPSADDRAVSLRLARACEHVGVDLLDHVVVGGRRWVSMARIGML